MSMMSPSSTSRFYRKTGIKIDMFAEKMELSKKKTKLKDPKKKPKPQLIHVIIYCIPLLCDTRIQGPVVIY